VPPVLDALVMALPAGRGLYRMPITGLGHAGLWVTDLAAMRSRPEEEHHEFVLQRGRAEAAASEPDFDKSPSRTGGAVSATA
jgi:hypothetical protein